MVCFINKIQTNQEKKPPFQTAVCCNPPAACGYEGVQVQVCGSSQLAVPLTGKDGLRVTLANSNAEQF